MALQYTQSKARYDEERAGCLSVLIVFGIFIGWNCWYIRPTHPDEIVGTWVDEGQSESGSHRPCVRRSLYKFEAGGAGLQTHFFKGYQRIDFVNERYTQRMEWVLTGSRLHMKELDEPFKDIDVAWAWKLNEEKSVLMLSDPDDFHDSWTLVKVK